MHAQALCAPLLTCAPGTFACDWMTHQGQWSAPLGLPFTTFPVSLSGYFGNSRVCRHPEVLSSGLFACCSWLSLAYFFPCSWNSDLCLEVPWCLECYPGASGTGRHAVYLLSLQLSWLSGTAEKAEGKVGNAYKSCHWASRLLWPKPVICGARWRTLSTAGHVENIIWVKFEPDLLAFWMSATVMYIL